MSSTSSDEPAYLQRDFPPNLRSTVLPMFLASADRTDWIGTAFAITSDGLLLTAGHVVDEVSKYRSRDSCALVAIVEGEDGDPSAPWAIPAHYISRHPTADLAAVWLDLPADGPVASLQPAALDVSPLPVGSECMAFGFSAASVQGQLLPRSSPPLYDRAFVASRGTVVEVHLDRFDRGARPYPLMLTDTPNVGGMSGSPVFGDDGTARGLVAAGSNDRCYVALLADALALWAASSDDALPEMVLTHVERRHGTVAGMDTFEIVEADPREADPFGDRPALRVRYLGDGAP